MVRSRCSRGLVVVRSRFGRGTVEVRSRYGRGSVAVRHYIQCSMVAVQSRYAPGSLVVRYTQGLFPPCILDAPRTWYTYCSFYCSNLAIATAGFVKYSLLSVLGKPSLLVVLLIGMPPAQSNLCAHPHRCAVSFRWLQVLIVYGL